MENISAIQLVRETDDFVSSLIAQMDLAEKIGQMCQIDVAGEALSEELKARLSGGEVGSIINQVDVALVNEIQRIAVEESRLGIPLLIGRDVIHGFKQFCPFRSGRLQAGMGIWSRLAQEFRLWKRQGPASIGPSLRCSTLPETRDGEGSLRVSVRIRVWHRCSGRPWSVDFRTVAQGQRIHWACAKHFAGYGAAESGRDYATTNIPENELRNVYLQPFHAAVTAGAAAVMTSFGDLNGIPCTANGFLLRQILREEWGFRVCCQ